jgi:hypothetical protein
MACCVGSLFRCGAAIRYHAWNARLQNATGNARRGRVEAGTFDLSSIESVAIREDAIGRLARVFGQMAREVRTREKRLKQQVREGRIEIDEARQARKVAEITETDYFRQLRDQAADLRRIIESGE